MGSSLPLGLGVGLAGATTAVAAGAGVSAAATARAAARPAAPAGSSTGGTRYLLALGDSLASGYQPTDGTSQPPLDPADGRPDMGYPGSYAADLAAHYHLRLVDLACPGETTASFSGTPAQPACGSLYSSWLHAGSQQAAAGAFLDAHRGQVALVTIDLGANNLDGCAKQASVDVACLAQGEAEIVLDLPSVLNALTSRVSRDDPGSSVVGMNYYDPFLALEFSPGGTRATAEAAGSVSGVAGLNGTLDTIDRHAHVLTADVATAFHTYSLLPVMAYGGRAVPGDVGSVCRLTWMCPLSGDPVNHRDVHPRFGGYAVIAAAFEHALAGRGVNQGQARPPAPS